jgi:hypothetical protein
VTCGEKYGKIGISNRGASANRLNIHKNSGVYGELKYEFVFLKGSEARRVENALKRKLKRKYTLNKNELPYGHTEAFPAEELSEIIKWIYLETILSSTGRNVGVTQVESGMDLAIFFKANQVSG